VWVRFDVLLDHNVEPVLGWRHLSKLGKASIWNARSSGNQLTDDVAARLEELWKKHTGTTPVRPGDGKDDDTDYADLYEEGGSKMRKHREIERSGPLRRAAKAYWNRKMKGRIRCLACTFDFGAKYGKHGREFIELHHEEHLSQSPGRKKKSVKALTPVCSNCHRMIHRYRSKPLTVKQLRKLLAVTASA
jgi:5-methylcytosine-specific restriction protein A